MNWENIFANNATNKGLIKKKIFKEDTQMANKHVQRCSVSLIIQFSSVQ